MSNQNKTYRGLGIRLAQGDLDCSLSAQLMHFSNDEAVWEIEIWDSVQKKHVYSGNLQETIELILLGKLYKEQLTKSAGCINAQVG